MFKFLTSTDYVGNVPVCIIRFVLFAPMGIYQALATNHWNVIKNHSELQSGIYGTRWATGEILAHKWVSSSVTLCYVVQSYFHRIHFVPLRTNVIYLLTNYPFLHFIYPEIIQMLTRTRLHSAFIGTLQFGSQLSSPQPRFP
jgi:hypothetical protein